MSNDKRRRLLIDHKIQGSLAVRILVHWIAFLTVSLSLTMLFHFLAEPLKPISQHVSEVLSTHRHFLLVSLVMIPAFVYDSIQMSNRFAGPILRFRRLVKEVGHNRPVERLQFRDGDFWQELSLDINGMLDRLQVPSTTTTSNAWPGTEAGKAESSLGAREATGQATATKC
ncbi:MAG: hypothetical protein U0795_20985 [Pirellulales bacterium]